MQLNRFMDKENFDLDKEIDLKSAGGNKDLWLFLIIIDIVFLCVFGFLLYKNLSANVFNAPSVDEKPALVAEESAEPIEEVLITQTQVVESPAVVAEAPVVTPMENAPSTVFPVPAQQTKPEVKPEVKADIKAEMAPSVKKESVLVNVNPKSKYRKVTFRYFDTGKKVAIVSGFTMAKQKALSKKNGYWETTLSIAPGSYKYLYVVDGVNTLDPHSDTKDGRSFVTIK